MHVDDNVMAAFAQGALDADRAREVEQHVAECPECDALLVGMARLYGKTDPGAQDLGAAPTVAASDRGAPVGHGARREGSGRYRLAERLGEGGMGVVFAAWDALLDRKVAIKLLRPALAGGGEARLVAEARALAKLSHPNVVQVFDVGRWDGDAPPELGPTPLFVAMEHVDGWTLREWMTVARPGPDAVLDAIEAAADALIAVHDAGLTHRDLKPDNVMIGRDGRVRVTDFGLARPPADPTGDLAPALSGTPAYMAPEQLLEGIAGPAADQFALCVTLVEALGGRRPFEAHDLAALRDLHARRAAPSVVLPAGAPGRLRGVIERGLASDPARRHPDVRALVSALREARARRPSPHIRVHVMCLVVLTFVHVGAVGWIAVAATRDRGEAAAAWSGPRPAPPTAALAAPAVIAAPEPDAIDMVGATCVGCIALMWAPLGLFLAPLTAWGLWRRERWAWVTGVFYAVLALPTCVVTPYAIYALLTLPTARVREDLDR